MADQHPLPQDVDLRFTGPIGGDVAPAGWTVVIIPGSDEYFGTGRSVKVGGTIDGHPFTGTLLPSGSGPHMLSLNAALRKLTGKGKAGDEVTIHLTRRFS